ncbi:MAG: hypothetical protein AB7P67_14255 [Vicinamibacterales bacterium]
MEYDGVFASGTLTGTVSMRADVPVSSTTAQTLRVRPLAVATATGTAKFSGEAQSPVSLSGTYDTATAAFSLRGGAFTVNATVTDDRAVGTITTPAGPATVAAMVSTSAVPATRYCGTYRGTESGKLLIVVRGGSVSGAAAQDGDPGSVPLSGSVLNNSVSLTWTYDGGRGEAQGTISGTTVTGTWGNTDREFGTWSGGACR